MRVAVQLGVREGPKRCAMRTETCILQGSQMVFIEQGLNEAYNIQP